MENSIVGDVGMLKEINLGNIKMPICHCGHKKYRHSYHEPFKCRLTRLKFFGDVNKFCNCKGYQAKMRGMHSSLVK